MGVAHLQKGDGLQPYQAFVLLQKNMQHQSDCRLLTLHKQSAFRNAYAPIRSYNAYVMHLLASQLLPFSAFLEAGHAHLAPNSCTHVLHHHHTYSISSYTVRADSHEQSLKNIVIE